MQDASLSYQHAESKQAASTNSQTITSQARHSLLPAKQKAPSIAEICIREASCSDTPKVPLDLSGILHQLAFQVSRLLSQSEGKSETQIHERW